MQQRTTVPASLFDASIKSIVDSWPPSPSYVVVPCCSKLCNKNSPISSTIKSPSPCLPLKMLSPPYS